MKYEGPFMQSNNTEPRFDDEPVMSVYTLDLGNPDRVYIGSSVDVQRRTYDHLRKLSHGTHPNKAMQKDFDPEHGVTYYPVSYGFSTETEMRELEQAMVTAKIDRDGRSSLYNKATLVYPMIVNGGRRGKRVEARDRNGKVVATFKSGRTCAKILGVPRTTLWSAMNDGRLFNGYLYVYAQSK